MTLYCRSYKQAETLHSEIRAFLKAAGAENTVSILSQKDGAEPTIEIWSDEKLTEKINTFLYEMAT